MEVIITSKQRQRKTLPKARTVRLQVEILETKVDRLGRLMAKTGLRTKRQLVEHMFVVLEWAITQTEQGGTFGCMTPQGNLEPLCTPVLENVQDVVRSREAETGSWSI